MKTFVSIFAIIFLSSISVHGSQESLNENRQALQDFVSSLYSLIDIGTFSKEGYIVGYNRLYIRPSIDTGDILEYRPLVTAVFTKHESHLRQYRFYDMQGNLFTSNNSNFISSGDITAAKSLSIFDLTGNGDYLVSVGFLHSHVSENHFWQLVNGQFVRVNEIFSWGYHFLKAENGNLYLLKIRMFDFEADIYKIILNENVIQFLYLGHITPFSNNRIIEGKENELSPYYIFQNVRFSPHRSFLEYYIIEEDRDWNYVNNSFETLSFVYGFTIIESIPELSQELLEIARENVMLEKEKISPYLLSNVIDQNQESLIENRKLLQYFVSSLHSLIDIGEYTESGYVKLREWHGHSDVYLDYRPLVTAVVSGLGLSTPYRFYDRQGNLLTYENSTFISRNGMGAAGGFNIFDLTGNGDYLIIVHFWWSHTIEHHFWKLINGEFVRINSFSSMWNNYFIRTENDYLYHFRLWSFNQLADVYRLELSEDGVTTSYVGIMLMENLFDSSYSKHIIIDNISSGTLFSPIEWETHIDMNWQLLTTSPYRPTFVDTNFTELLSLSELEENLLQTAIQNYLETPQAQIPHGVVPISRHIPGFFRTTANLRIRQYPTTDSDTLFIIPMGIVLELQEHNHHRVETPTGNWYRLHHSFQITDDMPDYWFLGERPKGRVFITGYVYGGFLEPTPLYQ